MTKLKKTALMFGITCVITAPGMALAEDNLVEANTVIGSNISNGLDIFGQVKDVVLDESGDAVQYVLFSVSETFAPTRSDPGFVDVENVSFRTDLAGRRPELIVEDADAQRKPEELTLTREEADRRLLSTLLDESVQFSNEEMREIDNILIDPDTGRIAYFLVDMETESLFEEDIRAIPAAEVSMETSGGLSTSSSLWDVDNNIRYEVSSL